MIIVIIAGIFINVVLVGSYFILTKANDSQKLIIESNSAKANAYSQTQSEIGRLSTTLSGARTLLDQQVLYSSALRNLGASMTEGTIIEKIDLSAQSFAGTPVTVAVYAKNTEAVASLRSQLSSSPYFTGVNIDSISETQTNPTYPVTATLKFSLKRTIAQ
jgi:hypothetical protein